MEEGLGIAVETGQKVHFGVPGAIGAGERTSGTLASLAIMGHFAGKAAQAGVSSTYTVTAPSTLIVAEGSEPESSARSFSKYSARLTVYQILQDGPERRHNS